MHERARPPSLKAPRGVAILRRGDGRSWEEALEPVLRDTAGDHAQPVLVLNMLDLLVRALQDEHSLRPFPEQIIHLGPGDGKLLDATSFASAFVGHRAERLSQAVDLAAAALDSLEHGSVQLAAVAARTLLELGLVSQALATVLDKEWGAIHGHPDLIRAYVTDWSSPLWMKLWEVRVGTRVPDLLDDGWPAATNILTHRKHFADGHVELSKKLVYIYDWLCDATHPNVEAQATMWRVAPTDSTGRRRVCFDPSNSESPTKLVVVEAVKLGLVVIINLARDLWWVAAEVACMAPFKRKREVFALGLPVPDAGIRSCCCGSGAVGARCTHPQPPALSEELAHSELPET